MIQPLSLEETTEIFSAFLQDALANYPQLKGTFAIVDASTYVRTDSVDLSKTRFIDQMHYEDFLRGQIADAKGGLGSMSLYHPKYNINIICTYRPLALSASPQEDLLVALDHELGHLLVMGALSYETSISDTNYKETASDIFQCLRDYKRNGKATDMAKRMARRRAEDLVLRPSIPTHFTSFALEELDRIKDKIDIQQMTSQQILTLSCTIASHYSLNSVLLNDLNNCFLYIKGQLPPNASYEDHIKVVANVLCHENLEGDYFNASMLVLGPYLDSAKGSYWDNVRRTLKRKRIKTGSRRHIVRNAPQKTTAGITCSAKNF